jgi:hypothetical protein
MAENVEQPVTPPDGTEPPKKKVTFDDEQQVVVQGLIDKAQGQVYQKLNPEIATLKTQIDELKAELKAKAEVKPEVKPEPPTKRKEAEEQLAQMEARLEEMRKIAEDLKREKENIERRAAETQKQNKDARLKEEFIRASEKIDFFDRMEIFDVLKSQFDLDDRGNVVVLNPSTGEPRKNLNLEPMSLTEFLQQYAKDKPWKVKAKNTDGGTGAGESRRIETERQSTIPDVSKMKPEEFLAYTESVIAKQYDR